MRSRVAAALGTKVIQREQQAILASGWNQVSEIRTVNDALRVLQLTRGLLQSIYARHYTTQNHQRFFHLTRMVHDWVTCDGATVCTELKASRILPGFMSAQWLRLERARGPVGRLQGRPGLTSFVPNPDHIHVTGVPAERSRAVSLHLYGRMMNSFNTYDISRGRRQRVTVEHNES